MFVVFSVASYFFGRLGATMELRWSVSADDVAKVLEWREGPTCGWKTVPSVYADGCFVDHRNPEPCCSPPPVEAKGIDGLPLLMNAYREQVQSLEAIISRFQLHEELRIKSEAEAGLAYRRLA